MSALPKRWAFLDLDALCYFNPKHGRDTPRSTPVTFLPMAAVDEFAGTIATPSIRPLDEIWKGFTHFADGDVLFAKITPCMENGKVAVAKGLTNGLGCGSTEFHVLRSKGNLEPDYLWRFLRQQCFRDDAEQAMTGVVGQRRVPTDYLRRAKIPVPPLPEQRRILAKLDSLTGGTARARAELERIPRLIQKYREAILVAAHTQAVIHSTRELPLGEIAVEVRNGLSRRPENHPPGIPILKISAIRPMTVRMDELRYYVLTEQEDVQRFHLRADDLLFTRYNGNPDLVANCGLVGRVDAPIVYPDKLIRVRLNRAVVEPAFVDALFTSVPIRQKLEPFIKSAAGQHGISGGDLKSIKLPIPALSVQMEITHRIETAFAWLDRVAAEHANASRLLPKLDQAILAKAFRGDLVPQDPNDKPAELSAPPAAEGRARRGRSTRKAVAALSQAEDHSRDKRKQHRGQF